MSNIVSEIEQELKGLEVKAKRENVGVVTEVGDGIARIDGLSEVQSSELVEFESGVTGLALNLESYNVGAVIFGDNSSVKQGDSVKTTGKILQVPVGEGMVGRVVNALGEPIDGKGKINPPAGGDKNYPVEKIAPGVITRQSVSVPLQTGIKSIDALIPIGRGQRELIIGDRNTGKTTIAIDTIVNQTQTNSGVVSIYVAIGQKTSKVAQLVAKLEETGAMKNTIVIAATASDPATMQYLAPYSS